MLQAPTPRLAVLGTWLLALAVSLPLGAQNAPPSAEPQTSGTFAGEERVTAVDLLVDVIKRRTQDLKSGPREELSAGDFGIVVDGTPLPLTGLRTFTGAETEPWQLVIYFDAALTSSRGLAWAATALTEQADTLTRLGTVEVVVADPTPRRLLPPTRDSELLGSVLGQLAVSAEGLDQLVTARAEYLRRTTESDGARTESVSEPSIDGSDPEAEADSASTADPTEIAPQAVAAEQDAVLRQQDQLLLRLAGTAGGPRRALLLVSGGWDVDPAAFYQLRSGDPMPDEIEEPALGESSGDLARSLAAYGWVVIDLLRPEVPPEKYFPRGKRLGKWRMTGFLWTYEDQRDPAKAEAFLELGDARRAEGKAQEAAEAYRQAIHHFYKDPRTAKRQAAAFAGLAEALGDLGQEEESRWARQQAAALDPAQGAGQPTAGAVLLDPAAPLEALAEATAGAIVQSPSALAEALDSLERRVGLSFQLEGPPLGRLLPVEVSFRRLGFDLRAPGWVRSSTPEGVSAARARRLAEGEDIGPDPRADLETPIRFQPGASATSGTIDADLSALVQAPPEAPPSRLLVRITIALGGPDLAPQVEHQLLELVRSPTPDQHRWTLPVTLPLGSDRIAVVVEDLGSGRWQGETVELGEVVSAEAAGR